MTDVSAPILTIQIRLLIFSFRIRILMLIEWPPATIRSQRIRRTSTSSPTASSARPSLNPTRCQSYKKIIMNNLLPTTYHLLLSTYHLLPTTCHLPLATCHLPPATCHLPPATRHLPPTTYHLSPLTKYLQYSCEASDFGHKRDDTVQNFIKNESF
jgi:hypothetical protein